MEIAQSAVAPDPVNSATPHNRPAPDADPQAGGQPDYERIVLDLQTMAAECRFTGVNLAEFFGRLHAAGFALISLVLAMPFLQPLPLGPFGTVAGFSLMALGWQMYRGRRNPLMPSRLLNTSVRGRVFSWPLTFSVRILKFCRKFCRPRLQHLVAGEKGRKLCGLLICSGGLLMCAPFIAVPFNNMLPAGIVFFAALADLEQDGMMIWVALAWMAATFLFFGAIIAALLILGAEAIEYLAPALG